MSINSSRKLDLSAVGILRLGDNLAYVSVGFCGKNQCARALFRVIESLSDVLTVYS